MREGIGFSDQPEFTLSVRDKGQATGGWVILGRSWSRHVLDYRTVATARQFRADGRKSVPLLWLCPPSTWYVRGYPSDARHCRT